MIFSTITTHHFVILGLILFSIGVIGVIARRNIFVIYMSIELMLNGINLIFVAFSRYHLNMDGQIIAILLIAVAAVEAAVFLSVIILLFRSKKSLDTDSFVGLKWLPPSTIKVNTKAVDEIDDKDDVE